MKTPKDRYPYGIPAKHKFIKVTGEDGIFFDLVASHNVSKHIAALTDEGYEAESIATSKVPPCTVRDFTDSLEKYTEVTFKSGTDFYHSK